MNSGYPFDNDPGPSGHSFVHHRPPRAQSAPVVPMKGTHLALKPPAPPPRPKPPPVLMPGMPGSSMMNNRANWADLSFQHQYSSKQWNLPPSNRPPPDAPPPPVPVKPQPDNDLSAPSIHVVPTPPLPPKIPASSGENNLLSNTESFLDFASPITPLNDATTVVPAPQHPSGVPPALPSSDSLLDCSHPGSTTPVETEALDQADTQEQTTESPTGCGDMDEDLAEALRRSLLPPESPPRSPDVDDVQLALVLSSLENEETERAHKEAERERSDRELAYKLQVELEAVALAAGPTSIQPSTSKQASEPQSQHDLTSRIEAPPSYDTAISNPISQQNHLWDPGVSTRVESTGSRPVSPASIRRALSADAVASHSTRPQTMFSRANTQSLVNGTSSGLYAHEINSTLNPSIPRPASVATSVPTAQPTDVGLNGTRNLNWKASRVDVELLKGVSFGFCTPPTVSSTDPMTVDIPDVIPLPPGPALPFHLQARSWRSLLRLLATLDSTRLEPSLEAMAVLADGARLRTVIQFNQIDHATNDWRVVIYLTLDHALPPSARGMYKYMNGDTTTLPYSYTLCQPPLHFVNHNRSQFFNVPGTAKSPFPTLPIVFPNLALYLQSAVEDSRKAMNDTSGGFRRLAKMVDQCYPDDVRAVEDDGEREGSTMKRLFGGKWRKPKDRIRSGNEEVYDLVTPFRIDEYQQQ